MAFVSPQAARPWTFRLMVLSAAGFLAILIILGSAAFERRADRRDRASMIEDLRRFDRAQRDWEAAHGEFARFVARERNDTAVGFNASPSVTFRFESRSPRAWAATARSEKLSIAPMTCGIFRGEGPVAPHRALTDEGAVACW